MSSTVLLDILSFSSSPGGILGAGHREAASMGGGGEGEAWGEGGRELNSAAVAPEAKHWHVDGGVMSEDVISHP